MERKCHRSPGFTTVGPIRANPACELPLPKPADLFHGGAMRRTVVEREGLFIP